MKQLYIKPTSKSLEVTLEDGYLIFKGCSINNDPRNFFTPIKNWVLEYMTDPKEITKVDMHFEYIDTSSVKYLFEILKELKSVINSQNKLELNWYYEKDDPEVLELGEIMQSKLGVDFNFEAV